MSDAADPAGTQRALVLGGGGPVGVAWELGLAAGLASGGVDLSLADRVVGTSAGSITGALLKGGDDPAQLVDVVAALFAENAGSSGADQVSTAALGQFMELMFEPGATTDDPQAALAHLQMVGKFALEATTIPEESFVGTFTPILGGRAWPPGFACTAVDANSGAFRVWDAAAEVPLERAVASSCAVPGVYPPITVDGARYMDGGARSPLNADLAAGYEAIVVVSVMIMELPPGFDDPRISGFFAAQRAAIDAVRATGSKVEVIAPDVEFMTLSGLGMNLMDFSIVGAAAEAGVRLGKLEAERIAAIW